MPIEINSKSNPLRTPWNKGRLVGQKRPLRPKEVWAIRFRLQIKHNKRDLAMFNLSIGRRPGQRPTSRRSRCRLISKLFYPAGRAL